MAAQEGADERPLVGWRFGATMAVLAGLILTALIVQQLRRPDLPSVFARDYMTYVAGDLPLDHRTADPRELAAWLEPRVGFPVRVHDFRSRGYSLRGGRVYDLRGRPAALVGHQSDLREHLVCLTFRGTLAELPATSDVRERGGTRFHIHRKASQVLVVWQRGEMVELVDATLPAEQVVKLAFVMAGVDEPREQP
jgi:anti-sigma factor RsiW